MLIITNELSMLIIKFKEIKILKNVWKQTKMKHSSAEPLTLYILAERIMNKESKP